MPEDPNTTPFSGRLRAVLEANANGRSLGSLTVLATKNDPFRVDTPARHRDGEWLAVHAERLGLGERTIHLRGLHYMLVSGEVINPYGKPFENNDADWTWLQEDCAKAARWLGYIPFSQIVDARNAEPIVLVHDCGEPFSYVTVTVGVEVEIPTRSTLSRESASPGSPACSRTSSSSSARRPRCRTCSARSPPSIRPTSTCRRARSPTRSTITCGTTRRRSSTASS
jgi:hypothetical protein